MTDSARLARLALYVVLLVVGLACAGCAGGGRGPGLGGSGSGGTALEGALARISDTPGHQSAISYDNTAKLVPLAGTGASALAKGYWQLRNLGTGEFISLDPPSSISRDTGINELSASYAVSAGPPSSQMTLIAGGQDGSLVTAKLEKLGWKASSGGVLAGPPTSSASAATFRFAESMQRVRTANSDVLYGSDSGDQVGSPAGTTLAGDPGIRALADCLGNVVAAMMFSGADAHITAAPTEVALGLGEPATANATPQLVACVSWPTQQAADAYAATVKRALATGTSIANFPERYSALLRDPKVTSVGGPAHVIEWQATPADVAQLLQMKQYEDVPALPACGQLAQAVGMREGTAAAAAVTRLIVGCH